MQLHYKIEYGRLVPANVYAETWTQKREGQAVVMEPVSETRQRSLQSNAKLWAWYRQIGDETGQTSDEVHRYVKYHIGLPVLAEADPDRYAELRQALGVIPYEARLRAMDHILCTSIATRSQMNEIMERMQRIFAEQDIDLE